MGTQIKAIGNSNWGAVTWLDSTGVNTLGTMSGTGAWTFGSASAPGGLTHIFKGNGSTTIQASIAVAGSVNLELTRTVSTPADWILYIPNGSTDLRFFSTADMGTVSSSGAWTLGPSGNTAVHALNTPTFASATAGSASLPANPSGFFELVIAGTTRKIPYYNV